MRRATWSGLDGRVVAHKRPARDQASTPQPVSPDDGRTGDPAAQPPDASDPSRSAGE